MTQRHTIKDSFAENRVFLSRIVAIFIFICLLVCGLIVRLAYLQIVGHERYSTLAKSNRVKTAPLPPTRGIIYDRKGRVLAENITTYSLELIPEQIKDIDETLQRLTTLLAIPDEKIKRFLKQKKRAKKFSNVPLLLR
jgi:penicillin-binding protein 2